MKRRGVASKQRKGMTTMTKFQPTKVLLDAELDAVVGGTVPPKAIQAMEIHSVERENIPKALLALFIHEIETGQQGWRPL
jgi:hypothetical protein